MKENFKNQIILITGASMGIGKELALAFAQQGAKLALTARNLALLESVAEECRKWSPDVLLVKTDVTDPQQIENLLSEVKNRYGKIDILVNNAGKGLYGFLKDADMKDTQELFSLNFFSIVNLVSRALPLLRMEKTQHSRKILIQICSISSFWPVPKMGLYCASKAALSAYSKILGIELKKEGIQVLTVYPGVIRTAFSTHSENPHQEKIPEEYKTTHQGLSPQKLAQSILRAAARGKKKEYGNFSNHLLIKSYQYVPSFFNWIMGKKFA